MLTNPINLIDPDGYTALGAAVGGAFGGAAGAIAGGVAGGVGGTLAAPGFGTIAGGVAGAGQGAVNGAVVGAVIGDVVSDLLNQPPGYFAKPPENAYDPNGPKAPGKPGEEEGFSDPKRGDSWVPNPNGRGSGWESGNGKVWVPTGKGSDAHGGPHWDVQDSKTGRHKNVYPGGRCR